MRLAFLFLVSVLLSSATSSTTKLTVVVDGIEQTQGYVYVALFNQEKGFPDDQELMFVKTRKKATGSSCSVFFEGLNPGNYAFAVYYDLNENGELDKGWFGIPQEPFCFSKNYKPIVSAPDYEDCVFELGQENSIQRVLLLNY